MGATQGRGQDEGWERDVEVTEAALRDDIHVRPA